MDHIWSKNRVQSGCSPFFSIDARDIRPPTCPPAVPSRASMKKEGGASGPDPMNNIASDYAYNPLYNPTYYPEYSPTYGPMYNPTYGPTYGPTYSRCYLLRAPPIAALLSSSDAIYSEWRLFTIIQASR